MKVLESIMDIDPSHEMSLLSALGRICLQVSYLDVALLLRKAQLCSKRQLLELHTAVIILRTRFPPNFHVLDVCLTIQQVLFLQSRGVAKGGGGDLQG